MSTSAAEDFKAAVHAYIELHNQLAEANKQLATIRRKKKELADVIVEYMRKNALDECHLKGGGKLVRKNSKRLGPIKEDAILEVLKQEVGPRADALLLNIVSSRGVMERDSLRRVRGGAAATE